MLDIEATILWPITTSLIAVIFATSLWLRQNIKLKTWQKRVEIYEKIALNFHVMQNSSMALSEYIGKMDRENWQKLDPEQIVFYRKAMAESFLELKEHNQSMSFIINKDIHLALKNFIYQNNQKIYNATKFNDFVEINQIIEKAQGKFIEKSSEALKE